MHILLDKLLDLTILQILGYLIALFALLQLYIIYFIQRNNIVADLRGKDKMWQFVELSGLSWLVISPVMVVCDMLGVSPSDRVWLYMDTIFFMNLGYRASHKYIESKYGKDDKSNKKEPKGTDASSGNLSDIN